MKIGTSFYRIIVPGLPASASQANYLFAKEMCENYPEIDRLAKMLDTYCIPYTLLIRGEGMRSLIYPLIAHPACSVIEGNSSYGGSCDELEIMGLLTKEESTHDEVLGGLTAKEVFDRIFNHFHQVYLPAVQNSSPYPEIGCILQDTALILCDIEQRRIL